MKVGSFVSCIDGKFTAEQLTKLKRTPIKGDYYNIRGIIDYPQYKSVGVRLEEINNPEIDGVSGLHEPTFSVRRFVELDIPPSLEIEIENLITEEIEI